MSEWQSIETAPLSTGFERNRVLLWIPGGGDQGRGIHGFGYVYEMSRGRRASAEGYSGNWDIRWWQPLPDPPLTGGSEMDMAAEDKRDG